MRSDSWPFQLLAPKTLSWFFTTTLRRGGRSLANFEQRDRVDGGPNWGCALTAIPVFGARQIAAHAALEAILVGDLDTIVVERRPPACEAVAPIADGVPHSDSTPFSDETLYSTGPTAAVTTAASDMGAVEVNIQLVGATRELWAGEEFTFDHLTAGPRLYRVKRVLDRAGDVYALELHGALREDVGLGATADFNRPRCLMRLEELEGFRLALENNERGEFDAIFGEAIW